MPSSFDQIIASIKLKCKTHLGDEVVVVELLARLHHAHHRRLDLVLPVVVHLKCGTFRRSIVGYAHLCPSFPALGFGLAASGHHLDLDARQL